MAKKYRWYLGAAALVAIAALFHQHVAAQAAGQSALLFNYVTNQRGLDTGIAISNASFGKFGSVEKAGTCSIYYYGSLVGGAAPPPRQTTFPIPPGGQAVFLLSSGGTFGINATPGFEGYMIVICNFPLARGVAVVQDLGLRKFLAPIPAKVIPAF